MNKYIVIIGGGFLIFFLAYIFSNANQKFLDSAILDMDKKIEMCYSFLDWDEVECLLGGRKVRDVKEKKPKCDFLDQINRPESVKVCNFKACSSEQLEIGKWGDCIDGLQKRIITPNKIQECGVDTEKFPSIKECSDEVKSKTVTLSKNYETKISTNGEELSVNPYRENNNNLKIKSSGKFKSAKLIIENAKTYVLGGEEIKIGADYYIMFALNRNIPRAMNLKRVDLGEGNTKLVEIREDVEGMFKGTETPKNLSYDLRELLFANSSAEKPYGQGYLTDDYLKILNENNGKALNMTVYLADGRSMTEPDEYKRIFGSIDAFIEYECFDDSECNIEVIKDSNIEL